MDTAAPKLEKADATTYAWHDADPAEKAAHSEPTLSMDGGPQVSQPAGEVDALPVPVGTESPRAATMRRLATAAAGVGLVAAAVLTARGLTGANARAGENVIDYDD